MPSIILVVLKYPLLTLWADRLNKTEFCCLIPPCGSATFDEGYPPVPNSSDCPLEGGRVAAFTWLYSPGVLRDAFDACRLYIRLPYPGNADNASDHEYDIRVLC